MKPAPLLAAAALALLAAPSAALGSPGPEPRLAVAFFSAELLAEASAVAAVVRIERVRLDRATWVERTGLVWTRDDNGADIDWYGAEQHCSELALAGWRDWRMPSIEELATLHERRSTAVYKLPAGFRLTGCCPWSSTPSTDGSAWSFSFLHRQRFSTGRNLSFGLRALCARSASAEEIGFYERAAREAPKVRQPVEPLIQPRRRRRP